jgi:hypothetical protein
MVWYDWCPYIKRRYLDKEHAYRENVPWILRLFATSHGPPSSWETGLEQMTLEAACPANTWISALQTPELRLSIPVVSKSKFVVLSYDCPGKQIQDQCMKKWSNFLLLQSWLEGIKRRMRKMVLSTLHLSHQLSHTNPTVVISQLYKFKQTPK